jgi:hypothetical protein
MKELTELFRNNPEINQLAEETVKKLFHLFSTKDENTLWLSAVLIENVFTSSFGFEVWKEYSRIKSIS